LIDVRIVPGFGEEEVAVSGEAGVLLSPWEAVLRAHRLGDSSRSKHHSRHEASSANAYRLPAERQEEGYDSRMLGHDWEPAKARIVAKKFKEGGERSGAYEYVADVSPASGGAFRTKLKQPPFMSHVVRLVEGDVVDVLADVKHQDAKFDRSDPKVSGKVQRSGKDAFDAALKQPPLSPPVDDA
jgi:hypothetical protein